MNTLREVFGQCLPGKDKIAQSQEDIGSKGEIEVSTTLLDKGYAIRSRLFENFIYCRTLPWKITFGNIRHSEPYCRFANQGRSYNHNL
jgi:hypothetical protein